MMHLFYLINSAEATRIYHKILLFDLEFKDSIEQNYDFSLHLSYFYKLFKLFIFQRNQNIVTKTKLII